MPTMLLAILPVFALIGAGFAFGRLRGVGADGIAALNGFTVWLALPALLFRALAEAGHGPLAPTGFVAAFAIGMAATFALGLACARPPAGTRAPLADRSLAALTGAYANTAFIGIPIGQGLLGETGVAAAVVASILTVSLLFAFSLLLVEIAVAGRGWRSGWTVVAALARNPLIVAPVAGALWAATEQPLPAPAARFVDLLAAAASPCALVTIGAFLALPRRTADPRALGLVLGLKLVAQPLLTALAAYWLLPVLGLGVPHVWATAAVLIAALPTGTGPFMLAELHGREAALASRAILLSTCLSLVTIAAVALLLLP